MLTVSHIISNIVQSKFLLPVEFINTFYTVPRMLQVSTTTSALRCCQQCVELGSQLVVFFVKKVPHYENVAYNLFYVLNKEYGTV